ncbi:MAG: TIGR02221 family CRISPR-associated protein [Syntrophorhabdaceae bacterium]|nr:TIGR02221 family CRISPR-associated protein [Syntrophorhabdaceae bacterium]MDD4197224.1 TIGR02221 family CRISPR-associated protein [Syntrophorhabdaceae bacterium]
MDEAEDVTRARHEALHEKDGEPVKRVLIAFLGRGDYQETMYDVDGSLYRERLAFRAIYRHFHPIGTTFIIGTEESQWEMLAGFPHERVTIPYGRTVSDFWETFDILERKIDVKDSDVIFDLTHGFRVLPLFGAIYVRFLRYVEPSFHLLGMYYGSFERGKEVTPVVDLAPFIDLLDWMDAANAFMEYGEMTAFAAKVSSAYNRAHKEKSAEKPKVMGMFSKKLEKMSQILQLTYTPMLSLESKQVCAMLEQPGLREEIGTYVKPLGLLLDRIAGMASAFVEPTLWESHLKVAEWYSRNKRFTQSLLVLREVIITCLCENTGSDPYDLDVRERITAELNEQCQTSKDPIHRLWNRVRRIRNNVGHAFMKQKDDESTPAKMAGRIRELIDEASLALKGKER